MWIVKLALRRPYTFVVMALAILLAGGLAIERMPADIFPEINIPIVSVVWQYGGLTPEDMADMITTRSERGMTTTVNDIEHMESQSYPGHFRDPHVLPSRRQDRGGHRADLRSGQSTGGISSRRARARRTSFAITPPRCRFCNSGSPATRMSEQESTISAPTSSAPSSPPSRAPAFRRPMAASSADDGGPQSAGAVLRAAFPPPTSPPR